MRVVYLSLLLCLFCRAGQAASAGTNAARPNIIVILADDLGYSDLGCYGSEIHTPNLDRLAEGGLKFSQFYTTPRCCPTRAALLTGLYPQQAGIGDMMQDKSLPGYRGELDRAIPTIAERLRAAGYQTLMVGKWHVCHIRFDGKKQLNHETDEPFWPDKNGWPLQRGFQDFYGTIHGVCGYYDPFSLVDGNTPAQPSTTNFYYTDAITDRAVSDIDRYAGRNPFFLYVAYTAPHWPLQAPEAAIARYREGYLAGWDVIRSNRYQRQIELGLIDKSWPLAPRDPRVKPWSEVSDRKWEANRMATYAAMVERLDIGVGRILEALRERNIERDTLVIFFSDNGACAEVLEPGWYDIPSRTRDGRAIKVGNGDHTVFAGPDDVWQSYGVSWANVSDTPFRLYKHFTHEGGIAVPFIASWPAKIAKGGATTREIAHVTDIVPTLLDAAEAASARGKKSGRVPPLEGQSLIPFLAGETNARRSPVFWEHEGNRAVRLGQWKLVARHNEPWELYDLETDRTEQRNLAGSETNRVKQMASLYDAWAKRCGVVSPEALSRIRTERPPAGSPGKTP
jgi:arylsulfatase